MSDIQENTQNTSLLKEMFEAGVHFGHQTKFWNPKMKPYIYGARNKIHILNLDITVKQFQSAQKIIHQEIEHGGSVLFVGTRSQASEIIAEQAIRAGMPYVNHRWLGGMLTNFETVKKSIKKLETKKALLENINNALSKKDLLKLTREVEKLERSIGGIANMKKLPTMIFIIDTGFHDIVIKEALKLGNIKVIGIVDSNNSPDNIDCVIPGNDDSGKAIELYASKIADEIIKAKESATQDLVNQIKVEMVEDEYQDKTTKTVRRVKKTTTDQEADTQKTLDVKDDKKSSDEE